MRENGDLLVSAEFTVDGVALGKWIARLRYYKNGGTCSEFLTEERIAALNGAGMVWNVGDYIWERNFTSAKAYFAKNGNLNVPAYYVDENGVRLGQWLGKIKAERGSLSEEKARALSAIGMERSGKQDSVWQQNFEALCTYKAKNGSTDVPAAYVSENGCKLGRWVRLQRDCINTMSGLRREKLDNIGFEWTRKRNTAESKISKSDENWNEMYLAAKEFCTSRGNLRLPPDYRAVNGKNLSTWVKNQKLKFARGELSPSRLTQLEEIGINNKRNK